MKQKIQVILIPAFFLFCLVGCRSLASTPESRLLTAQKSFRVTVEALTDLREAGQLGDDEIADITILIVRGDQLLDEWTEAVLEGEENPKAVQLFEIVLDALMNYTKKE